MKTFTDKAEVTSKCHLDDVDIQINENRITEYNEEGVTINEYAKSKDLIIVGTSDGKRIKFTIKGDFNTILEMEE